MTDIETKRQLVVWFCYLAMGYAGLIGALWGLIGWQQWKLLKWREERDKIDREILESLLRASHQKSGGDNG